MTNNFMKRHTSISRRSFLLQAGALSGLAALPSSRLWAQSASVDDSVEKVLVMFKTHLDVGFTNLAANVIQSYFDRFIPGVLALSEQMAREQREDRYVWTTGSWLIYRYLEEASSENRRRMERAILAGDFVWHGLPFSTHTELMDASLFRLATAFSARLDQRFGRKTIAAKMTDVPGHARGAVPIMAEAGLELLHVGVNPGCAMPDVPPVFVWRSPDGTELPVMFQHDYGEVSVLPGGRTAVAILSTQDNEGPHTPAQIADLYATLRRRFTRARVFASNLNALATEVKAVRSQLPIVTQEIGDSWIYGPASDPWLVARFRELSRQRLEWISDGRLVANGDEDVAMGQHLLCIPEHTWGLAIRNIVRSEAFDMESFRAARKLPEFRRMEESWQEKRANLTTAIAALPPALAREARTRMDTVRPVRTDWSKLRKLEARASAQATEHFKIGFDPQTGAIASLEERRTGRQWAGPAQPLGLFSYQIFSQAEFDRFVKGYVKLETDWAVRSWQKPGLAKTGIQSALHVPALKQLWTGERKAGRFFVAELEAPEEARKLGCPHELAVEIFLPHAAPNVEFTLKWFEKPACRLAEALWFSFVPAVAADGHVGMDKMGQTVSPHDVVADGNRQLHGVIDGLRYEDARGGFTLETREAFLLSPGRRSVLIFDNAQPDPVGGQHFCLFNNAFGTNFTMWFEDDMQFRFILSFNQVKALVGR